MSSNCPPQLHLELTASTTSFKRSFDQFGFDLESPLGGSDSLGASGSDGNDRNKRARSASTFSDDNSVAGNPSSSTLGSGSSTMGDLAHPAIPRSRSASVAPRSPNTFSAPHLSLNLPQEPPRLPTPDIEDIDMSDYPLVLVEVEEPRTSAPLPSVSTPPAASQAENTYRQALERFNTFESQISALRRSPSPSLTRADTPPYILPPLQLSGDEAQLETNTIFRHVQRSPRLLDLSSQAGETSGQNETRRDDSRTSTSQSRQGDFRNVRRESPRPHGAWSQITRDERAGIIGGRRVIWPYLFENSVSQSRNHQDSEDSDESVQPAVRPSSPVPVISELRSPSPLFDLEELHNQAGATTANRNTPPTLPPIHGHDETWELEMLAWDDARAESSTSGFRRTLQPPPLSRISIPSTRERDGDHTTGSTSESSSSSNNHQPHTLPSPFSRDLAGWLESGHSNMTSWFMPSPTEEHSSLNQPRNAATNSHNNTRNHSSNFSASDDYPLESFTTSRLDTLHGLGEALQGIGRALQESELTLRPFILDNYPMAENSRSSTTRLSNPESASSDHRRRHGLASITGTSEAPHDDHNPLAARLRSRLSAPSLHSPLENHMRPWLADRGHALTPPPSTGQSIPPEDSGEFDSRRSSTEQHRRYSHSPEPPMRRQRTTSLDGPVPPRWQSMAPSWFHAVDDAMANESSTSAAQTPTVEGGITPEGALDLPLRTARVSRADAPELETYDALSPPQSRADAGMPTHITQNVTEHHSHIGSTSRSATNETGTRLRPRHFWPNNRAVDAGLFGLRQTPTHSRSASSSAALNGLNASFVSTPNLLRLRSRPPSSHAHSHSIPSGYSNYPHTTSTENPSNTRRRFDRLELIQTHRQARAPTDTQYPNPRLLNRHDAPRENEVLNSRHLPPARSVFSNVYMPRRLVSQPNRLPNLPSTVEAATSSDRWPVPRSSHTGAEPLTGRLTRPSGLRVEHHSSNRSESSNSGELPLHSHRRHALLLRNFVSDHIPSRQGDIPLQHQPSRDFLPIPSLPSPEFDGVFDFASHDTDEGNTDTRPRQVSPPTTRRSTSPFRGHEPRQRNISPPGHSSPRQFLRRDFNPENFAPGPFRNTIQRLHDVNRAREARANEPQSGEQHGAERTAPSIPPLLFEDDFRASSLYLSDRQDAMMDAQDSRHHQFPPTDSAPLPRTTPSFTGRRQWLDNVEDDEPISLAPIQTRRNPYRPDPRPSQVSHNANNSETLSRQSDIHNFLSRHPRIEASRLDNSGISPGFSQGDEDGFHHALEVLRHDGLSLPRSQELINRFHRERQRDVRAANASASPWGILEQNARRTTETTANEPPHGRIWRRGRPAFSNFDHMNEDSETASSLSSRDVERARSLRGRRFRLPNYDLGPVFPHGVHEFIRMGGARRGRPMGDYIRDEDFDESYESLLSLAATLGDVKPKCTPDSVIAGLETGLYKDWKSPESDHRCSICLDDYQPDDLLLKLTDCSHWLHRECLQQWLKSASTCPVCRKPVTGEASSGRNEDDYANEAGPSQARGNLNDGFSVHPSTSSGLGPSDRPGISDWLPPWRYRS